MKNTNNIFMDKVILLIMPSYFGYEKAIINKLGDFGAKVIFFEEFKYTLVNRIIRQTNKRLLECLANWYYVTLLNRIKKIQLIDYLFVIRGHKISEYFILKIMEYYPDIKKIMYQWDSQKNNAYIHLKNYFDKIFTFDYCDSRQYNIPQLSLFFTDEIYELRNNKKKFEKKYDYFILASYSPERYVTLLDIWKNNKGNNFKIILYIHKITFLKEILKKRKLDLALLSFAPIKKPEYLKYLLESRCVIDVTHSTQSGLPIRVIEAIGALIPVLTTAQNIVEFSGITSVGIINNKDRILKIPDLNNKHNQSLVDEYSLDNWLRRIFA